MSERKIRCPRCGKPSLFSPENPYRPFCSERCKMIDLGNWADGKYAIPASSASESAAARDSEADDDSVIDLKTDQEENSNDPDDGSSGTSHDHH